jgi:hypothetical protein
MAVVFFSSAGVTTGTPILVIVPNTDQIGSVSSIYTYCTFFMDNSTEHLEEQGFC